MPTIPSISSSFTALQKQNVPTLGNTQTSTPMRSLQQPGINWGAISVKPPVAPLTFGMPTAKPAVPSFGTMQGSTPAVAPTTPMTNFATATPAIPQMGNVQSNDTALKPGQFGNTPAPATPMLTDNGKPNMPTYTPIGMPTYTPAPYAQANSGITVDPNTGGVVTDASGSNTGNSSSSAYYSASAGGSPALPYSGGGSYDPLITSPDAEDLFKKYQGSLVPTQEELDAMTNLNALNTAAAKGYTDTQNQPIALPFITGQQAALQRSQTTLAQPLESQISLLQAKRQMASTASKAALDRVDAQIAAKRDLAKPVSTAFGGTLSRYNPQTGKYETVVNPFGSADGGGGDVTQLIGQAISEGRITADQVTRYGIPFIAETLKTDPNYNFITQKASVTADTQSLKTQQLYADSTDRAFKTANANLQQLVSYMTSAGINSGSTIPIINELQNKVKAGVTSPGTIAAYQAALAGLRAEYAQVLSRGGEVTEGQRAQAASLIPDNLTPQQLQEVTNRLNVEGTNAVKEAQQKVSDIQTRLKSNPGGSSGTNLGTKSTASGSIYDF